MESPLFSIPFLKADGKLATLGDYAGKVMLIVNVASKCGFTPQYAGLQKLFAAYRDQGLVVLGFPANDFLSQEPGNNAEIQQFCSLNYGVEFPVFAKIKVKGKDRHPLYAALTSAKPEAESSGSWIAKVLGLFRFGTKGSGGISWNFEKFLVGRNGEVTHRFAPGVKPEDSRLVKAIESELAATAPLAVTEPAE